MSRRKQAKPRALKRDEVGEEFDDESPEEDESLLAPLSGSEKNFTDHIITGLEDSAIVFNPLGDTEVPTVAMETENNFESGLNEGTGTPTSWRSTDTPDDQSLSLSPTSCATPSDPDVDLTYTIGVTENTPYACQFCDKAFPRLSYLKRHEQIHSDQMPFKCDYCQRLFKHKRSRDRHIKLHTGDKKYRCPHCESAFSRSDHLKIHLKTHDHAKPFQCTVCNRGYNTAAALTSHMQNHKKESAHTSSNAQSQSQSFRCLQCSAFFSTAKDLQAHVETHREGSASPNEKTSQCAFCHEFCPSPGALRLHVEQSHPSEAQGKCPECREIFPSLQALVHHKKIHIDVEMENIDETVEKKKESNKFLCGFCAKSGFSTLDSLQLHVKKEHVPTSGENMGHFLLNSPSFGNISSLALTCQQRQVYGIKGNFICEYCNMKFGSVHSLQKHTLTVHSFTDLLSKMQENIFCSECKLGFPSSGALAEHINTLHEGRKNESPNNDPSPSASKDSILMNTSLSNNVGSWDKSSMQTKPQSATESPINETVPHFPHSGPLLCSQCNAAFPDFESFRTHLKTHLDAVIQKYTCSECEVEFPTEQQLNAHVMTHFLSTSTEYGCRCCLKLFSKPDELQKHLMDIHAHHLYRCSLCKEIFDSKVSIQVHFAVKHSNECRLFKCTSCNAVFHSEMEFQLHVKVMHLFKIHPFRCLLCDQCFSTEYELQYHLNTHKKQFSCAVCDEAFHVEFLLDKHMEVCHNSEVRGSSVDSLSNQPSISTDGVQNLSLKPSNDKPETPLSSVEYRKHFSCEICEGIFSSETHLSSHCRQVHNIRTPCFQKFGQTTFSLFCAYCNESCKSRTELENHMKAHTVSPSKHKCNICDELCPTAATLAEHKLSHCKVMTGGVCVTCKKTVQNEEEFYKHIQEHNANGLPVPCVVCRQTLMSDVEIQVHAKFHLKTRDPLYPCCVCARQFEANKLIITGKQDNGHTYMCKDCFHARSEDLRCPECKVKFETVSALEKHKLTHKKTYQCIKCQMSFESETEIQAHVTSHMIQEGTSHECKLCHTVFESPAKLQCHLIEHTFEGCSCYTCYMCSTVFTAPHLIQQHMLEHGLSSRPYDCSHCHQRFFFRAELENHSHMHKENIESGEQLNCPDCTKVFNSIINLNNHRKIHEQKNNTLKCSSCPELFHNSADMQQHYFRYHGDSELDGKNKCFPCTECGKEFPCLSNLQGHVRIHAQGTKYTCPECKKEFALSRNLNIHLRSHSGEKPYECPICKKRFARKENRKAHLKSHTGLKPFMCPHCGKTFSRKCHVKEHMRIHITSTTHPCELCTETFRSLKQLKRHLMDAHQKQYDHVCSVCGDVFNQSKNLQTHMQNKHDIRPTNSENDLIDVLSEFSPSQSSASGDIKDFEGSETNSLVEEGDTRGSSVSATQDKVTLPTEVAA